MSQGDVRAVIGTQELAALVERAANQHERLTGPPIPVDFTYDRNGLRLGIAALEDELRELYDEWAAGKKNLDDPAVAARLHHEALDIAAVGLGQGLGVVDVDHHQPPGWQLDERAVSMAHVQEMGNQGFHYLASPISGAAG